MDYKTKIACLEGKGKYVIFDLDGTLADIEARRKLSLKENGKLDWDKFFDPENIKLDQPNTAVIKMAQLLHQTGHQIVILSGRSAATKDATWQWLSVNEVPHSLLCMRPEHQLYVADDKLKQDWLEQIWPGKHKENIVAVFDDRNKVVDMWRKNGLPCFQVAPGDF